MFYYFVTRLCVHTINLQRYLGAIQLSFDLSQQIIKLGVEDLHVARSFKFLN